MKLNKEQLEKMFPEKSAFKLDNNYENERDYVRAKMLCSIYNEARNEIIDKLCEMEIDADGETSDGYHTFNELYEHRVLLWINLVLLQHPEICYLVEDHYDGWFLLGVQSKDFGQISYHCPNKYLHLMDKIPRRHPKFDGHTSQDIVKRLEAIANSNCLIIKETNND